MRWKRGKRSRNVEDRRGQRAVGGAGALGLLNFIPMLVRSKGGRTILIIGVVVFFGARMLGIDLLPLIAGGVGSGGAIPQPPAQEQELVEFVSFVLADTEETWHEIFREQGGAYTEPVLVLFNGQVNSACGMASSAVGPFYCPGDNKLYIDLSFFNDLDRRHGAPGDFAQAYVVAHEVGHHVQSLLGISRKVQQAKASRSRPAANELSVRQELQADCFAGLWGYAANIDRRLLDPGDLEEALTAASAIGDDRLQREAGRGVVPDSFTHGTSEQRVRWFKKGFESGDLVVCDTFSQDRL